MSRPREATSVATSTAVLPALKVLERGLALGLRLVAVDRVGVDVVARSWCARRLAPMRVPVKTSTCLRPRVWIRYASSSRFLLARNRVHDVRDELGSARCAAATCTSAGLRSSVLRGCGSRPGRWPRTAGSAAARQQRDDALDVGQEAHVEHAVGLVEHQDRDLVEHHRLVLHVVEQPPGRRDEDLDARAQLRDLRVHVDAAVDDGAAQRQVLAVVAEALGTCTRARASA
jgi:hypothetical protein